MNDETAVLTLIDKVLCLQKVDLFKHATTEMLAYIEAITEEIRASQGRVLRP